VWITRWKAVTELRGLSLKFYWTASPVMCSTYSVFIIKQVKFKITFVVSINYTQSQKWNIRYVSLGNMTENIILPMSILSTWSEEGSISINCWQVTHSFTIYKRCYREVPGLGQKRNSGLTYSILTAISFRIVSLGMHTAIPWFFPHFKSLWK
jgi:hypothetical protein